MAQVEIKVRENGPYKVTGPVRLIDVDGNEYDVGEEGEPIALCRSAMGARPLRRAIQRYIEDPLADEVLAQNLPAEAEGDEPELAEPDVLPDVPDAPLRRIRTSPSASCPFSGPS